MSPGQRVGEALVGGHIHAGRPPGFVAVAGQTAAVLRPFPAAGETTGVRIHMTRAALDLGRAQPDRGPAECLRRWDRGQVRPAGAMAGATGGGGVPPLEGYAQ